MAGFSEHRKNVHFCYRQKIICKEISTNNPRYSGDEDQAQLIQLHKAIFTVHEHGRRKAFFQGGSS